MNALSAMPSQFCPDGLVAFADDSPSAKAALETVLRRAGYDVAGFDCADDLIDQLDGMCPNAIILDIEMPGMNGFEFAEALQDDAAWGEVPIIALSSHTSEEDFERVPAPSGPLAGLLREGPSGSWILGRRAAPEYPVRRVAPGARGGRYRRTH